MGKHRQKTQQPRRFPVVLLIGMMIVLVTVGAFVLLSGSDDSSSPAAEAASGSLALPSKIQPQQYQETFSNQDNPHFLLDVRTTDEFNSGHIAGAANISVETLATQLDEVPNDVPVVVYCRSGNRSATAADILRAEGYEVYDLGGIIDWTAAGYQLVQ